MSVTRRRLPPGLPGAAPVTGSRVTGFAAPGIPRPAPIAGGGLHDCG